MALLHRFEQPTLKYHHDDGYFIGEVSVVVPVGELWEVCHLGVGDGYYCASVSRPAHSCQFGISGSLWRTWKLPGAPLDIHELVKCTVRVYARTAPKHATHLALYGTRKYPYGTHNKRHFSAIAAFNHND